MSEQEVRRDYRSTVRWSGSSGVGSEKTARQIEGKIKETTVSIGSGSNPGSKPPVSPEELVVMAASSCHLLSFLYVAGKSRVEVIEYEDDAVGELEMSQRPIAMSVITLNPRIIVREPATMEQIDRLMEVAHRGCYIANSLSTPVEVHPTVTFVAAESTSNSTADASGSERLGG